MLCILLAISRTSCLESSSCILEDIHVKPISTEVNSAPNFPVTSRTSQCKPMYNTKGQGFDLPANIPSPPFLLVMHNSVFVMSLDDILKSLVDNTSKCCSRKELPSVFSTLELNKNNFIVRVSRRFQRHDERFGCRPYSVYIPVILWRIYWLHNLQK